MPTSHKKTLLENFQYIMVLYKYSVDKLGYYEVSNDINGITFSGGDPLFPKNRSEVFRLIQKIKKLLKLN